MRFANEPTGPQDILEKPRDKEDNMRMLLDLNGGICEVVTGVSVGAPSTFNVPNRNLTLLALDLQCFRCSKPRGTRSSRRLSVLCSRQAVRYLLDSSTGR